MYVSIKMIDDNRCQVSKGINTFLALMAFYAYICAARKDAVFFHFENLYSYFPWQVLLHFLFPFATKLPERLICTRGY